MSSLPATSSAIAGPNRAPAGPATNRFQPDDHTVEVFNPLDDPKWDASLATWTSATFFHTSGWLRVLHDAYGYRPCWIGVGEPGNRQSVFPLVEVDSWLTGRRGVCLPFTDECTPLYRDDNAARRAWEEARRLARQRRWRYIEWRGGERWLPDPAITTKYLGHDLSLTQPLAALWRQLDDSTRRAVRKAQQSQLAVEFSQEWPAMRDFYVLLGQTRRRHGLPPQPISFFRNIHRHIVAKEDGCIVLARLDGRAVAGAVFFRFRKRALYKFGASDSQGQRLRANNLVMWHAIQRFHEEGLTGLDFGRTTVANEGLRRFKRGWGAAEREIAYFRHETAANRFTAAHDHTSGWHTRIFRILPSYLSRLIGSILYKHVA